VKYLIMLYGNPMTREWWAGLSDAEKNEAAGGHFAINEALAASGEMIVTQALADPATGKRVSLVDGQAVTSDGPFAEVKEYLAGFYLVEVDSPERAVEIAGQFPEAEWGLVEVRPILELGGGSDV
jgi:hypothetical protein